MNDLLIVDRIAQGLAVCETEGRDRIVLLVESLPDGVHEGDCLREQDGVYRIDRAETDRRRARNRDLFRSLLAGDD